MPDMAASVFVTLQPRSASRARACITISQLRPAWPLLSPGGTETVSLPPWRVSPTRAPGDAIATYRSAFRAALDQDGQMCLFGVLGAEAGVLSPEVAEEIQSFFRRCIDDLSHRMGGPGRGNASLSCHGHA